MSSAKVYTNELDVIGSNNNQIWSLGTTGNINTSNFDLTTQQKTASGLTGLVYSLVRNPITKYVGNTISIDQVNGNDTIAATNKYSFPYKTITAGLSGATGGDIVFVNAGTYNEYHMTIPQNVSVRGASVQSVNIQNLNATASTEMFMMEYNSRLEDVTLNLGSGTNNLKLVGIQFNNGSSIISKLRTAVVNVGSTGNNCVVYGIESDGTTVLTSNSSNAIRGCTINVNVGGTGSTGCAMMVDGPNRFTTRDTNFYCNNSSGNIGAGTFIGAMINCSAGNTGVLDIKTSTISGDTYDVARVGGDLKIGATDLLHSTTDGNSFTPTVQASIQSFGLLGDYPTGPHTYYLTPGNSNTGDIAVLGSTGAAVPFSQNAALISVIMKFGEVLTGSQQVDVKIYKNNLSTLILGDSLTSSKQQSIIRNISTTFTTSDSIIVEVKIDNFTGNPTRQLFIQIGQY